MRIKWDKKALANLKAEVKYISQDSPKSAKKVASRIKSLVTHLSKNPHMGRASNLENVRDLIVPSLPYIVRYRVRGELIEILAIFHTARKWDY
jgi:toxin ParE1/3/4